MPTPRTTTLAVQSILEIEPGDDLTVFIEVASELLTEIPVGALSESRMEIIERYLAAHFYCVVNPRTKMEWVEGLGEQYEGNAGMILKSTRYGQQAMLLDSTGTLAALSAAVEKGKINRVMVKHLGWNCK